MSTTELTVPALEERPMPPMTIAQSMGALVAGIVAQLIAAIAFLLKPLLGEETTRLVWYELGMGLAVFFACRIRELPTARASFDLRVPRASTWLPLALGSIGTRIRGLPEVVRRGGRPNGLRDAADGRHRRAGAGRAALPRGIGTRSA